MATLRVGSGFMKLSLETAIRRAAPGDVLSLSPGAYELGILEISGLTIVGEDGPGAVRLTGKLRPHGRCVLRDVVLQAPLYDNALQLADAGAHVKVERSTIVGEQGLKYPAVWAGGGALILDRVTIEQEGSLFTMSLTEGARLHATASELGGVELQQTHADLIDCAAHTVAALDRSRVMAYGALTLHPLPGKRAFQVVREASAEIAHLRLAGADEFEGYVEEAYLKLGAVQVADEGSLLVITKDLGRVICDSDRVTVVDQDAPAPARPKRVRWPAARAREFATFVEPQLNAGDTLVLEEGDYFFGDDPFRAFAVDVVGEGDPRRIVVYGCLGVMDDASVTIANLTVAQPEEHNAVSVPASASLTLEQVTVIPPAEAAYPSVYVDGTLTLRDSAILASDAALSGLVMVAPDARLTAERSDLGWLRCEASAARLDDCSSLQLFAIEGATVTATTHTLRANAADVYGIYATTRAKVSVSRLVVEPSEAPAVDAFTSEDASLTVAEAADGVSFALVDQGSASVSLPASNAPDEPGIAEPTGGPAGPGAAEQEDPLAEIHALTGLATVKKQVDRFVKLAVINREREQLGLKTAGVTLHSLFLGNPGTGKTTVARLLGRALHRAGVVASDRFVEVGRGDLVASVIGGTAKQTLQVLEGARGGVLFVDEAYALAQEGNTEFAQEAIDTILAYMENHRDDLVIIFAGYTDRMQQFLAMNPGLESRIPNRFDFEDYSADEISAIGTSALAASDYRLEDEELYRRVVGRSYAQSADRSNGRWVRNFNQRLIEHQVERVHELASRTADDYVLIKTEDIRALASGGAEAQVDNVEALLAKLDEMVGLAEVKDWVRMLANRVTADQRRLQIDATLSRPTYHVTFTGNPGTGKTTVARLVAQLFHALGVLSTPTVKEVDRAALVGRWIGESEAKTSQALDEAMGGVLFIDEAYDLYRPGGVGGDFGAQVIATLLPRLENDRDKFVAILAGYTDEMDQFFQANPGLRSRVPHAVHFADYSSEEVAEIVARTLAASWIVDAGLLHDAVVVVYDALPPAERANGRTARMFAEQLEGIQSNHIATSDIQGEALRVIPDHVVVAFARAYGVSLDGSATADPNAGGS